MDTIWAPWRIDFIMQGEQPGCFLCRKPAENNDDKTFILYRGKYNYIILNAYPYNPGHLLVAPFRHIGAIGDLTADEANEHFSQIQLAVKLLDKTFHVAAYNTGMNLGRIAGAGVADHIHSHIVPRWQGDTNFMPVVADTKVLPEALEKTYYKLKEQLKNVC